MTTNQRTVSNVDLECLRGVDIDLGERGKVLRADEAVHVVRGEVGREDRGAEVVAGVCLVADVQ